MFDHLLLNLLYKSAYQKRLVFRVQTPEKHMLIVLTQTLFLSHKKCKQILEWKIQIAPSYSKEINTSFRRHHRHLVQSGENLFLYK